MTSQTDAERRVILSYAPGDRRDGLAALLALDDKLAAVLRSTREPLIGQMRLTWWREALMSLAATSPPGEPVLTSLANAVLPHVDVSHLVAMAEGWEELLAPDLDDAMLRRFAAKRGAGLFAAAGQLLGVSPGDPLAAAGRGWALADLAAHSSDPRIRVRTRASADDELRLATGRWSRRGRALGAMAHLARMPDRTPAARVGRMLLHRLTGF